MRHLIGVPAAAFDDDMRAFGLVEARCEEEVRLWPENVPVIDLLPRLNTAWRYAPMGGVIGFDWPQVTAMLRLAGVPRKDWRQVQEGLRVAEVEIVKRAASRHATPGG